MPNPNPIQSQEFKKQQFQAYGEVDVPLAKQVTGVKLPVDVDEILRSLPSDERVAYLRRIICEAVRRDFMSDGDR